MKPQAGTASLRPLVAMIKQKSCMSARVPAQVFGV